MRKIIAFIGLLLIGACKSKTSHTPQGMMGLNAPQEITLQGSVSSDIVIVNDPRIVIGSNFSGIVIGSTTIQMPYFLNAYGTNVYFHVQPIANRIVIFNAQKANAKNYTLTFDI